MAGSCQSSQLRILYFRSSLATSAHPVPLYTFSYTSHQLSAYVTRWAIGVLENFTYPKCHTRSFFCICCTSLEYQGLPMMWLMPRCRFCRLRTSRAAASRLPSLARANGYQHALCKCLERPLPNSPLLPFVSLQMPDHLAAVSHGASVKPPQHIRFQFPPPRREQLISARMLRTLHVARS
jgi:hypothetical protein